MDLKLDSSRDIEIIDGELSIVVGNESVSQDVKSRLLFFLGEWFLDTRLGVDWFGVVFVKGPVWQRIRQLIRTVVIQTPGVRSIRSLDFSFDSATRELSVAIDVELEDLTTYQFSFSELLLKQFQRVEAWPTA
jgi:hypothetical protein